jgi:predicted RNA-binding protein with PIN domain
LLAECHHLVVDGHSVVFALPALRRLHASRPREARAALVRALQHFQDFSGIRVSLAFDGREGTDDPGTPDSIEVRYASRHQTADALIERAVASHGQPAELVVVTGDGRERTTVESLGARTLTPEGLLDWIRETCPSNPIDQISPSPAK